MGNYALPRRATTYSILVPVMVAHEMNFFYDEGLRGEDGFPGESPNPEERKIKSACDSPRHLEAMPFPIDGLPTGFEDLLEEEKAAGDLSYDNVPDTKDVCALDLAQ